MNDDLLNEAVCERDERRDAVRAHPTANGIDFVEYFEQQAPQPIRFWLVVTFVKNAPAALINHPEKFKVDGGVRIVHVAVTKAAAGANANQLEVDLDKSGDFSLYRLRIDAGLDVQLDSVLFTFKPSCPTPFDCRVTDDCPPEILEEPVIDYLAKDYGSFRRLLLDFASQRNPSWTERNPADVGIMLVELLAYAGDHLSSFQDAVANEAFLDTCRRRVSARRHARLIDYRMHDGRNAWTYVQLKASSAGDVPRWTRLLTPIARPLRGKQAPPPPSIPFADLHFDGDPALVGVTVFETTARIHVDPLNNDLTIHAWGDEECCLPAGTTSLALFALNGQQAVLPALAIGDLLLIEEVKGSTTGLAADADASRRQVVRLIDVDNTTDDVFSDTLNNGALQVAQAGDTPLPLQHVRWSESDALKTPFCLSARNAEVGLIRRISVARGNVAPCDHGRTIRDVIPFAEPSSPRTVGLPHGPLTMMSRAPATPDQSQLDVDHFDLATPPAEAEPAIELDVLSTGGGSEAWRPVIDLLDDNAFGTHFVAEVGDRGETTLRFGDDEYGRRPDNVTQITATYRIGNGRQGNIGSGSLAHISPPSAVVLPGVASLWQPLPAIGGAEPQSIEEVRQLAPAAFRAEQFRAVTEADYEAAAKKVAGVAAAKCVFRWTGSWRTVFVAIHPFDPANLITLPTGQTELRADLAQAVSALLRRYKLAGYDLEIRAARYVPLWLEIDVCVATGYFRGDVLLGVSHVLSNRRFADGTIGFFHPSRFRFGEAVYLSRIYEAVQSITGVDSAVVKVFQRYWSVAGGELSTGVIGLADDEIARLDNDPNFPENGKLVLTALGGS